VGIAGDLCGETDINLAFRWEQIKYCVGRIRVGQWDRGVSISNLENQSCNEYLSDKISGGQNYSVDTILALSFVRKIFVR